VDGHFVVLADLLDGSKVAVGNTEFTIRRGELQPVADGKFALYFPISGDAVQSGRIVSDLLAIGLLDGQQIRFWVG
jgi:hypothetical protein